MPLYPFRPAAVTAIQDLTAAHTMPAPGIPGAEVIRVSEESSEKYASRLVTLPASVEQQIATYIPNRKAIKLTNTGAAVCYHNGQPGVTVNNDEIPPLFGFVILETKGEVWAFSVAGTTLKILEEYY